MANKNAQKLPGKLVEEYLRKHPDLPRLTIAKRLHADLPNVFPSIESARSLVRKYTGSAGDKNYGKNRGLNRPKSVSGENAWKSMMPASKSEVIQPFMIPSSVRRLLILSDIHFPYHDEPALDAAINYGISAKPDAVYLNGDIMDQYAASFHAKDPRKVNLSYELECGRAGLAMLRQAFPGIPIYFREANHEYRLERYLMQHAPILLGEKEFQLRNLLNFGEHGIQHVEFQRMAYAGKLTIAHGDEWKGMGGVNPARWLSLRTGGDSALVGHFHRTSQHIKRSTRQSITGWWSTGCLCELRPDWLSQNDWNHGFAVVDIEPDGGFEVHNKVIIDGVVR